jgi:hypothetical protein
MDYYLSGIQAFANYCILSFSGNHFPDGIMACIPKKIAIFALLLSLRNLLFISLLLGFCMLQQGWAQKIERQKWLPASSDTLQLDSLMIIQSTLKVYADSSATNKINFQWLAGNRLVLIADSLDRLPPFVLLRYQAFPFYDLKRIYRKDPARIEQSETAFPNTFTFTFEQKSEDYFQWEGLSKSGSITRGISFGNNQDVVVNSNLNLQISGKLSPAISIQAAVSDDNIPLQPEGNTRQLQEFDKVYIQVFDANQKLTAGDFQLTRPPSYFLNYYKRAQGGWYQLNTDFLTPQKNRWKVNSEVAAAVSRGKFSRMLFNGVEGNQGPYRLKGAENELFIIVLSGSERIYMDGELLVRGQENDYIIDYNTAELTFTAKRLVTKDKRIIAEFQYSDRNYARSLMIAGSDLKSDHWTVRVHAFSEQDNKNRPLSYTLNDEQKELLRSVGDSIESAFFNQVDTLSYSENLVLYAGKDTIVDGILYPSVFYYSTNTELAFYRPSFSQVGLNRGNYRQINSTANGKVFEWIAPANGVPQGDYEPVVLLPTPKRKRMLVSSVEYKPSARWRASTELAYTENNINTFAVSDRANDDGYAVKTELENTRNLSNDSLPWVLKSTVQHEWISRDFSPIERFRAIEFERDWNRQSPLVVQQQNLVSGSLLLKKSNQKFVQYKLSAFLEGNNYNGNLHSLNGIFENKNWVIDATASYLSSTGTQESSTFLRQKSGLARRFKNRYRIGVSEEQERSVIQLNQSDSLARRSFHFFEYNAYAGTDDTTKNAFELRYINRTDWLPYINDLRQGTVGETYKVSGALNENPNHVFKSSLALRNLVINDSVLTGLRPDRTLLSRTEYRFRMLKGLIYGQIFYEIGSGQEVKKEYSFLEVAPGQGAFTWIDYNENGVKELNEFEVAVFSDQAKYIKIFTPTNQFVKTFNNQFSQVINVGAPSKWVSSKNILKKIVVRFNDQFSYRIDRKLQGIDASRAYNPFQETSFDSALVSLNGAIRNTVFFNRLNQVFGADYTYQQNQSRILLTNGYESRNQVSHSIKFRWNLVKTLLLNMEGAKGNKVNAAEYFSTRNYEINFYNLEPKLTFQPNVSFRVAVSYRYSNKWDLGTDSLQRAIAQNLGTEMRYNVAGKGTLSFRLNRIQQSFNGDANSTLGFEMLEGLAIGDNYTWALTYQRTLTNNMQINLNYEGRKTPLSKIIHTGGIQVRAFF